jgi:uncharacterized protein (DUF697 family)
MKDPLPIDRVVRRARWTSVAAAVVLSPIPLADEVVLLGLYAWMADRIAAAHGLPRSQIPWRAIGRTALVGLIARGGLDLAVAVPGVSAVVNAASAAALTEVIARYTEQACADPSHAPAASLRWFREQLKSVTDQGSRPRDRAHDAL